MTEGTKLINIQDDHMVINSLIVKNAAGEEVSVESPQKMIEELDADVWQAFNALLIIRSHLQAGDTKKAEDVLKILDLVSTTKLGTPL